MYWKQCLVCRMQLCVRCAIGSVKALLYSLFLKQQKIWKLLLQKLNKQSRNISAVLPSLASLNPLPIFRVAITTKCCAKNYSIVIIKPLNKLNNRTVCYNNFLPNPALRFFCKQATRIIRMRGCNKKLKRQPDFFKTSICAKATGSYSLYRMM